MDFYIKDLLIAWAILIPFIIWALVLAKKQEKQKNNRDLFLAILLLISLQTKAQHSQPMPMPLPFSTNTSYKYKPLQKSPEIYVPAIIMASAFTINHTQGQHLSGTNRTTIALTGIGGAIASHYIICALQKKAQI